MSHHALATHWQNLIGIWWPSRHHRDASARLYARAKIWQCLAMSRKFGRLAAAEDNRADEAARLAEYNRNMSELCELVA